MLWPVGLIRPVRAIYSVHRALVEKITIVSIILINIAACSTVAMQRSREGICVAG
jgi:hypothetical protein